MTGRARSFLRALKAEAADEMIIPRTMLGPLDALCAEAELVRGGFITVDGDRYYLTPKGARS